MFCLPECICFVRLSVSVYKIECVYFIRLSVPVLSD